VRAARAGFSSRARGRTGRGAARARFSRRRARGRAGAGFSRRRAARARFSRGRAARAGFSRRRGDGRFLSGGSLLGRNIVMNCNGGFICFGDRFCFLFYFINLDLLFNDFLGRFDILNNMDLLDCFGDFLYCSIVVFLYLFLAIFLSSTENFADFGRLVRFCGGGGLLRSRLNALLNASLNGSRLAFFNSCGCSFSVSAFVGCLVGTFAYIQFLGRFCLDSLQMGLNNLFNIIVATYKSFSFLFSANNLCNFLGGGGNGLVDDFLLFFDLHLLYLLLSFCSFGDFNFLACFFLDQCCFDCNFLYFLNGFVNVLLNLSLAFSIVTEFVY